MRQGVFQGDCQGRLLGVYDNGCLVKLLFDQSADLAHIGATL